MKTLEAHTSDRTVKEELIERLERKFQASDGPKGKLSVRVVSERLTARFRVEPTTRPYDPDTKPVFTATAGNVTKLLVHIQEGARRYEISRPILGLEELEKLELLKRG